MRRWLDAMHRWRRMVIGLALSTAATVAGAAGPLVGVDWVKANVGKPGIAFIDLQPMADYLRGHIPGAVHTDYYKGGWLEDRADKVPEMFPLDNPEKVGQMIGKLGIDNDTHVVIVPTGANAPAMAFGTRLYWTFKFLGHDKVSVLDGGMAAYAKEKDARLETGAVTPTPKTFKVNLRRELLATVDDVRKALAGGKAVLVDNRTEDLYAGITQSPKVRQAGTLPGARNLPNSWLTANNTGQVRPRAQLEQLFKHAGIPAAGEQIYFCNTAHLSSLGWFVAHELLGNRQAKLYDGSMAEWTILQAGPVDTKFKFQ
ncbi:MAG: sulfurtransferase [Burkholderiaceae bacterium]|nr:sulfurtransferase [Burkholderiaceae bacterium]